MLLFAPIPYDRIVANAIARGNVGAKHRRVKNADVLELLLNWCRFAPSCYHVPRMGIIRFILAVSVAVHHLPGTRFHLLYAAVAVLFFFVISGFYMAMVLTEKYAGAGEFYFSRFLRLYPAYAAMALVMVAWFYATSSPTVFTTALPLKPAERAWLGLANIVVAGQDIFEFIREAGLPGIRSLFSDQFFNPLWMLVGQAWSLASEMYFYALAPFAVRSPRRIAVLLVASLAVRGLTIGVFGLSSNIWGYFFFPATLCMFLMGSLAYHAYARIKTRHIERLGWVALLGWGAWLVYCVAASSGALMADPHSGIDGLRFWIAYILFALSVPAIFAATRNNRLDRMIGELSYPLYLVHGLVQGIFFFKYGAPRGDLGWGLIAVSASVAAAIAMRIVVELPIETYRRRFVARLSGLAPRGPISAAVAPAATLDYGPGSVGLDLSAAALAGAPQVQAPSGSLAREP
jgi:peptidoglycan/LPS O-acetylase OafA/YrhL